jgi:hypothetical protein
MHSDPEAPDFSERENIEKFLKSFQVRGCWRSACSKARMIHRPDKRTRFSRRLTVADGAVKGLAFTATKTGSER